MAFLSYRDRSIHVGVILLLTLLPIKPVAATLYHCTDSAGANVLTDNPAQLTGCQPVQPSFDSTPGRPASATQPIPIPRQHVGSEEANTSPVESTVTTSPPGPTAIPLQKIGNVLVVTTKVNGTRDARLIFDTGASLTILSRSIAIELGLFSDPKTTTVTLNTVGGQVPAAAVHVDSIRVADAEVRNSLAAIYDLPDAPTGVEGLLGLSFLQKFEVTLDSAKGVVLLGQPRP